MAGMIDSRRRQAMGLACARAQVFRWPRLLDTRLILRRIASPTPLRRATLAILFAIGGAGAGAAETLADAVALAYAHNPDLNRQRYLQQVRDENYVQTRAQYGPQLSVQLSGNYGYQSTQGVSLNSDSNQAVVALSQPLYTSGRLRGALASARATVHAGQEQVRSTEQNTVRNAIIVYTGVIRDEARLAVGRENVAVLRDQLKENRARRGVGDVTLTDVGQADARLAAGESQLAILEANLAISRGEYLEVIGQNPGTLAPLPELPVLPASIDEALKLAEDNNPDLSASRYAELATSANAASVRGERGPSVSASVQGIYTNRFLQVDGRDGRKQLNAGVTLTQPLFAAGAIQSRVREADAQNLAAQVAIDGARRTALQAVTSAWSQLAAARTSLTAGERQVASAQIAFAGMRREQRSGLRSTIDVLNAEQELQAAQLGLLQNRYNEYTARAALLAAIGALNARTIVPDLDTYDPDDNFRRVRNRGLTPLEPIAMALDRIGSAAVRRPLSADLTGRNGAHPDQAPALPAQPDRASTERRLTPITESVLVPENSPEGRALAIGASSPSAGAPKR